MFKRKSGKKCFLVKTIALILSVVLMVPTIPAMAENTNETYAYGDVNMDRKVDAKYALVDYDQKVSIITNLYKNLGDTKAYSYITGGSSDDAPLLGFDYNTRRIKIKISGLDCWLDKYDDGGRNQYDIIPLSWVKSTAYYKVSNSNITHVIVSNMFNTGTSTNVTYGPKPTMLNVGNYYSYDGKYFYTDLKLMLNDYKNGVYDNSVNKTTPYYNYYLYLSHRSKSNYTSEDIDNYIENTLGYNKLVKMLKK